jgi:penicillin amidase
VTGVQTCALPILKGKPSVFDTVAYTIFGPVQYDASFTGNGRAQQVTNLAVRWKAHDASNEFKTFYLLNRATGYADYLEAIKHFTCPGQNFIFASKANDIAIWQQGQFPAKWKRQGDFIMPGIDSSYMWQGNIPQVENPQVLNPERGFVSSANQLATDTAYPYYQGGSFDLYRGYAINRYLQQMNGITMEDMQKLQTENYNVFAEMAVPALLKNIKEHMLSNEERAFLEMVRSWNLRNDPTEKGVAIFTTWFNKLEAEVWSDELGRAPGPIEFPQSYTLVEALLRDSAFAQADNINTPNKETVPDVVTTAFKKAIPELKRATDEGRLEWSKFKDSGIRHLLRQGPLSRFHLTTGGGQHVINATKQFHGPSWRMIVHLTDKTEAYGIYPGGQQGNPGSKYYDNFVDDWAAGKYHLLWVMTESEGKGPGVKYTMRFNK